MNKNIIRPEKDCIIKALLDFGIVKDDSEIEISTEHALELIAKDSFFREREDMTTKIPLSITFDGFAWYVSYNGQSTIGTTDFLPYLLYGVILNQDKIYSGDFDYETRLSKAKSYELNKVE